MHDWAVALLWWQRPVSPPKLPYVTKLSAIGRWHDSIFPSHCMFSILVFEQAYSSFELLFDFCPGVLIVFSIPLLRSFLPSKAPSFSSAHLCFFMTIKVISKSTVSSVIHMWSWLYIFWDVQFKILRYHFGGYFGMFLHTQFSLSWKQVPWLSPLSHLLSTQWMVLNSLWQTNCLRMNLICLVEFLVFYREW